MRNEVKSMHFSFTEPMLAGLERRHAYTFEILRPENEEAVSGIVKAAFRPDRTMTPETLDAFLRDIQPYVQYPGPHYGYQAKLVNSCSDAPYALRKEQRKLECGKLVILRCVVDIYHPDFREGQQRGIPVYQLESGVGHQGVHRSEVMVGYSPYNRLSGDFPPPVSLLSLLGLNTGPLQLYEKAVMAAVQKPLRETRVAGLTSAADPLSPAQRTVREALACRGV